MLTKVIIKNFGSIKDEVSIKINGNITALLGKNESGKSTVLRAINKLNEETISDDEKNVLLRNEESYVIGYYRMDENVIESINDKFKDSKYCFYKFPLEYGALCYSIEVNDSDTTIFDLFYYIKDDTTGRHEKVSISYIFKERIINAIKELLSTFDDDNVKKFLDDIEHLSEDEIITNLSSIIISDEGLKSEVDELISEIRSDSWVDLVPKYKYILFSSFRDILSDNILYQDLNDNMQALNLLRISKVDLNKLSKAFNENNELVLDTLQTGYTNVVSKKFKEIFHQTDEDFKLKIRFGTVRKEIIFYTQDSTTGVEAIPLSQRSDGFKWYLSLYLTLYDFLERPNDCNYVLLLDEPNLYLHPSAQRNLVYDVFYKDFSGVQIIYSTHSPYMIDIDNSFSVRIIDKTDTTNVYNSTSEYSVKKGELQNVDTLTPLFTALGLTISNDVILNNKDKVFVVEGILDVYVLQSFIKKLNYVKKMNNIKFVSSTGASKVPLIYSYLFGMGYNVFTLVDNDDPGRNAIKKILNIPKLDENIPTNFLTYGIVDSGKDELELENLFSSNDYEAYIKEKDVLYYKKIYDNVDDYNFEDETLDNFKKLFEYLLKL